MSPAELGLSDGVDAVSPGLAAALWELFCAQQDGVPAAVALQQLVKELPDDADTRESVLQGALAVLRSMGVLDVEADGVKAASQGAGLFLASLSKFLKSCVAAIRDPNDAHRSYTPLTKIYEIARLYGEHERSVDQEPLLERHVVNVIIKARLQRDWGYRHAYLHVYHPDWRQYHLIGLATAPLAGGSLDLDRQVAQKALRKHLDLQPEQYELYFPALGTQLERKRISETSGAITCYTFGVLAAKEIRIRLRRDEQLREDRGPFRWFTWDEVQQERSVRGEPIMFSTPRVLELAEDEPVPVSAARADDVRERPSIVKELGRRFTRRQLAVILIAVVAVLALQFLPTLVSLVAEEKHALANVADVAQIASSVVTVAGAVGIGIGAIRNGPAH